MRLCRLNDIIVSVNGVTTVNVTHAGAVDALKRAGYTVDLVGPVIIIDIDMLLTALVVQVDHSTWCVCLCLCPDSTSELNGF